MMIGAGCLAALMLLAMELVRAVNRSGMASSLRSIASMRDSRENNRDSRRDRLNFIQAIAARSSTQKSWPYNHAIMPCASIAWKRNGAYLVPGSRRLSHPKDGKFTNTLNYIVKSIRMSAEEIHTRYSDMVLVHGGGPGVEHIAASWADQRGVH